jgi:hypothetical protein
MIGTAGVTQSAASRTESRTANPVPGFSPVLRSPDDFLRLEFEAQQTLFQAQPRSTQRWLEAQARSLSEALVQGTPVRFSLPSRVVVPDLRSDGGQATLPIPADARDHVIGGRWALRDRLARLNTVALLRRCFTELELSPERAVAMGAALLRHTTAMYMVQAMLPAGRSVRYTALPGEEIATIPVAEMRQPASALTAASDVVVEDGDGDQPSGELVVPYVPAARRFYLPQWVILDDQGQLLVNSIAEAESTLASMQRFLSILHTAFALAPHILADEIYQQKRYGMLGQLVNQGRALACHKLADIVRTIQRRAAADSLNRGLHLSLPYFDDRALELKLYSFEVIPDGRIMFIDAFVVRAARQEQAKVAQDTRLSASTRKHLLGALKALESAFAPSSESM